MSSNFPAFKYLDKLKLKGSRTHYEKKISQEPMTWSPPSKKSDGFRKGFIKHVEVKVIHK